MAKKWIALVAIAVLFSLVTLGWRVFLRPLIFPEIESASILAWVIDIGLGSLMMLMFIGLMMYIGILDAWKNDRLTLEKELLRRAERARTLAGQSLKGFEQVTLSDLGGQTDDAGNLYVIFHHGMESLLIRGRSWRHQLFGRPKAREVNVTLSDVGLVHPVQQEVRVRSGL